jgi:hypothetical protein
MSICIGPHMIPCRACKAKPGEPCTRGGSGRKRSLGDRVHLTRELDAGRASKLIQW